MKTKLVCNPFELIAFEAAVAEHPACETSQAALRDFLQDNGFTHMGARQRVARIVREAREAEVLKRVKHAFATTPGLEKAVIHRLRLNGRFPLDPPITLNVWPNFRPTAYSSIPGYWEDRDGNRYSSDSMAVRAGYSLVRVAPRAWIDIAAALVWHIISEDNNGGQGK